jgi:hypothetical protein
VTFAAGSKYVVNVRECETKIIEYHFLRIWEINIE